MGDNFLNKYNKYTPNQSVSNYNANQVNNYNNYNSGQHQFESNDNLAHEVLSKAGRHEVYQRPGYKSEVSNVTRITTETTTEPSSGRYAINNDDDPIRINRANDAVTQKQNVRVRYLEPPEPQQQAPIVIRERQLTPPPPAPPIVIRQYTKAPPTPPPLVIRERPPQPPTLATQATIIDKVLPPPTPPPRQVIIERIPEPEKPREVIYEKWLPYKPVGERPVIVERGKTFERQPAPKNVIIEYEKPHVNLERDVFDEGIHRTDPASYLSSRPLNAEVREVDQINDLPSGGTRRSYTPSWQPAPTVNPNYNNLALQPASRPASGSSSVVRSSAPAGPGNFVGPWNTTYRASYTKKNNNRY